jgi:hypothetical protein
MKLATKVATQVEAKFAVQYETLQKIIYRMSVSNVSAVNLPSPCAIFDANDHLTINYCWGGTSEGDVEHVNALNNNNFLPNNNNPYFNIYNPGWRNHPNFSWRNNQDNPPQNPNHNPNRLMCILLS